MWFKKISQRKAGAKKKKRTHVGRIKSHKCVPRRFPEERQAKRRRSTCSSAFSFAGIAFAFFFVVVVVFARVLCVSRARGFG
jgi:hypothetical protein